MKLDSHGDIDWTFYENLTLEEVVQGSKKSKAEQGKLYWPIGTMGKPSKANANHILRRSPALIKFMFKNYTRLDKNCDRIVVNGLIVAARPCWVSKLKPSKDDGYVQLSHNGINKFCTNSLLGGLYHAVTKGYYYTLTLEEKLEWEGSHRCKFTKCLRHVCFEPGLDNQQRKGCCGYVLHPNGTLGLVCNHGPYCCFIQTVEQVPFSPSVMSSNHSTM